VTQPTSARAVTGDPVTFTVEAVGGGLTYQWETTQPTEMTWHVLDGERTPSLTVTAPAWSTYCREYRVVVSNARGTITSDSVYVFPTAKPPQFTQDLPETVTVRDGGTATFTVSVDSGYIAWRIESASGNDYIPWPASSTYTTRVLTRADDGMRVTATATVPGPNHSCGGGAGASSRTAVVRVVP
jgi:hypothetical protein